MTPLPWRVEPLDSFRAVVVGADGYRVTGVIARADAELIVRAVRVPGVLGFGCRPQVAAPARHPTRCFELGVKELL
jgi:hypothetical protein